MLPGSRSPLLGVHLLAHHCGVDLSSFSPWPNEFKGHQQLQTLSVLPVGFQHAQAGDVGAIFRH